MEQIIANGLYLGAQYALIALGLTLIFSLMNVLNFAHGQMYVFGGFVCYTVVAQLGMPFILGLVASALVLGVMGALIERFLFRPVIRRSKRDESTMLLAAGIAFFLDAVILLLFGEYNDESNTKVYALEYIIETLKANPAAIDDVEAFKTTIDTFEAPNPFMVGDAKLRYVGESSFGQKRQIAVPLVVNEYRGGQFETLFVAEVD